MEKIIISPRYPLVASFNDDKHSYIYDARTKLLTISEYDIKDVLALENALLKRTDLFCGGGLSKVVPEKSELENIFPLFENYIPRKFILEITDECTLRCKYCFFSDNHSLRKHGHNHMSLDITFKAIDYYYNMYVGLFRRVSAKNRKIVLKLAPPGISWWGGEPFTAFDVMQESLKYFESLNWEKYGIAKDDFNHSVATNFTILDDKMMEFLIQNKVLIYVSLDGMEKENDLNRIFINGKGSYNIVSKNIDLLIEKDPSFAKQYIIVQSVLANNVNDSGSINKLKEKYGISSENSKIRAFAVNDERTNGAYLTKAERSYINDDKELLVFEEILSKLSMLSSHELSDFIDKNNLRTEFQDLFALEDNIVLDNLSMRDAYNMLYCCPACRDVVFVSLSGDFHICNRVDYSHSLGSVSFGIDKLKMKDFFEEYYEGINRLGCKQCWALHFCKMCPGKVLSDSRFIFPNQEECEVIKLHILTLLKKYIMLTSNRTFYRKIEALLYKKDRKKYLSNKPVNILDYEKD